MTIAKLHTAPAKKSFITQLTALHEKVCFFLIYRLYVGWFILYLLNVDVVLLVTSILACEVRTEHQICDSSFALQTWWSGSVLLEYIYFRQVLLQSLGERQTINIDHGTSLDDYSSFRRRSLLSELMELLIGNCNCYNSRENGVEPLERPMDVPIMPSGVITLSIYSLSVHPESSTLLSRN